MSTTDLELDTRQRAMLAEMGVRVWLPMPAPPVSAEAAMPGGTAARVPIAPIAPIPPASATAKRESSDPGVPIPVSASTPSRPPISTPLAASVARPAPLAAASSTAPAASLPAGLAHFDWPALQAAAATCQACQLCHSRQAPVFGQGQRQAHWLVVGEVPSEAEDRQGQPFVGDVGLLLDNMLKALGLSRTGDGAAGAYLVNALKCRPPPSRPARPEELAQCEAYLQRQVALLQPKVILALGRSAAQALLQSSEPLGKLRGQIHRYQGLPVVVSYHPAALLRTPSDKAKAWADWCLALQAVRGG